MYRDPFLGGNNILVLCETYYKFDDQPTESNKRKSCLKIVEKCVKDDPWFGFEQVKKMKNDERFSIRKKQISRNIVCSAWMKDRSVGQLWVFHRHRDRIIVALVHTSYVKQLFS